MTDKEKAMEYAKSILHCEFCTRCNGKQDKINSKCEQFHFLYGGYLEGLAEGRKGNWHDLKKNPEDLPKCTENEQVIFFVKEYYESIDKCKNHFCLGVYKKSFLNDDVKLFVERSKGYECEHSTEDVLRWCELPKFEE